MIRSGQGAPRHSEIVGCTRLSAHTVSKCVGDSCKTELPADSAAAVRATAISDDKIQEHIAANMQTKPEQTTHWSARQKWLSDAAYQPNVSRIWRAFRLNLIARNLHPFN